MSDSDFKRRHAAWVAETLERLGPRPERRMTKPRSFEDEVPTSFSEHVASLLLNTPDEVILTMWFQYPLHDAGLKAC